MIKYPDMLYKYLSPDRIDVLTSGLIRYSPLGSFNDPFEGLPEITSIATESWARASFLEMLPQEIRVLYNQLPIETQALVPFGSWQQIITEQMKRKEAELFQALHATTPQVSSIITQKINELIGALCLSETPDNLLMWSHYAESHSGFVLAFDSKHTYFHEEKSPEDEFRHLRQVSYREARPSATLAELDGVDVFLVKSNHWSYEREWRIFRALSEASVVLPGEPFPTHLFQYPQNALKAVILGARTSSATVEAITSAIRGSNSLNHVRLKRATLDSSQFILRIGK